MEKGDIQLAAWGPEDGDAENARHEIAGHENAAPDCRGGKCEKCKCEKRDSMEHRVLHMSVHCRAGMHESTLIIYSLFDFIPRIFAILKSTTTGRTLRLHLKSISKLT